MSRTDQYTVPDAAWDEVAQHCYEQQTHTVLPNYAGLCLVNRPLPMVMNTWLEGGIRQWQLVCMGYSVSLKEI